jgi:outer membrane protein TolC
VKRIRTFTSLVALFLWIPLSLPAQEAGDTLFQIQNRPLADLVAALPGRPTELGLLVEIALERSLELEGAVFTRRIAEAGVDIQAGLFDPFVSLGTSLARSGTPGASSSRSVSAGLGAVLPWGTELGLGLTGAQAPGLLNDPSAYASDLSVTLSQPILDGFNVTDARYRAAQRERQAAQHTFARATEVLIAQIEILYWSLAETEALEAVRQRSYELAQALLSRNQQLADRELIAAMDVLTARSGVALRRGSLIDARRRRLDAADRLVFAVYGAGSAQQLQADTVPLKTATAPLLEAIDVDRPDAEAQALALRRDVAAARDFLTAATETLRERTSGLRPGLFLDGSWAASGGGVSASDLFGGLRNDPAWSLGLRVAVPLGNRSDRGYERAATWTVGLRRVDVTLSENLVRQDVREATRAVRSGTERLAVGEEAAQLAAAQLVAERQRLDLGLGDSFRLLETEENAVQAELESVRSRYDLARATTRLRLARGEIRAP